MPGMTCFLPPPIRFFCDVARGPATSLGGGGVTTQRHTYGFEKIKNKKKEREKGQRYYIRVRCTSRVRVRPANGLCAGRYLIRLKHTRTRPNDPKIKLVLSSWCNNNTMIECEITGAAHNRVPPVKCNDGTMCAPVIYYRNECVQGFFFIGFDFPGSTGFQR